MSVVLEVLVQDVEPSLCGVPSVATESLDLPLGDSDQPSDEDLQCWSDIIDTNVFACSKPVDELDEALEIR